MIEMEMGLNDQLHIFGPQRYPGETLLKRAEMFNGKVPEAGMISTILLGLGGRIHDYVDLRPFYDPEHVWPLDLFTEINQAGHHPLVRLDPTQGHRPNP